MTLLEKSAKFDRENPAAARIIAGDPERYPGALQLWASRVIERTKKPEPGDQQFAFECKNEAVSTDSTMPLFEAA